MVQTVCDKLNDLFIMTVVRKQHYTIIEKVLYEVSNSLVFSTDGTYLTDANSLMYQQISTGDGYGVFNV